MPRSAEIKPYVLRSAINLNDKNSSFYSSLYSFFSALENEGVINNDMNVFFLFFIYMFLFYIFYIQIFVNFFIFSLSEMRGSCNKKRRMKSEKEES